jgi:hypothetical protein
MQRLTLALALATATATTAGCGPDLEPIDPTVHDAPIEPLIDGAPIPIDAPEPDAPVVVVDAAPPDAPPIEFDCEDLPAGPLALTDITLAVAAEDLAFDDLGNLVGSDTTAIYRTAFGAAPTLYVPGTSFRAAIRYNSEGRLFYNSDSAGAVVRVDPDGSKITITSGLSYPNGMEVDQQGFVYVAEQSSDRVIRVHPDTGEVTVLSEGEIAAPNGLSFDPTYQWLYIAGFSGVGTIYKLPVAADGTPGELEEWATGVGTGSLDGIGVDACGNVYICDYGASVIYRIEPDGDRTVIVDGKGSYMPNMQWGSNIGGWDPTTIYIPNGWGGQGIYAADVGVPSKPRAYP